jgi:hypothetical protein
MTTARPQPNPRGLSLRAGEGPPIMPVAALKDTQAMRTGLLLETDSAEC